ncbi:alpha/beta hydrolase [Frankia sp. AgB1.9]|uniref:alpha/beta hydrolase n=1 Tax=unclassified Frankia TaxID=2632575 RepID=UPI001932B3BE|nr:MULTISPECIES: alpha/beta hydrolase [unclassified Frankia]MBL7487237.1 alpha/beta hydrolase [Frankia sp. AgW1.1]MBL7547983.1 alpha/beta hydrolase [Frankia sp. AgB1.9]MBL7625024.1 alpha/beta hydrolase [Frankia sp. AgB1.8]
MTGTDIRLSLHVPARDIPVPGSVSAQAQAVLAMGPMDLPGYPPLEDIAAWRAMIAARDAAIRPHLAARASRIVAEVEDINVDGVGVFVITPRGAPDDGRVFLDLHGGGLIMGGGDCCRAMGISTADRVHARTWAVDYRMPPDYPYPTPLDDCVVAYRGLLRDHRPEDIVVGGGSAGANLAAALVLRARDEGLPLPAGVVLLTPELDLTESGDSFQTNLGVDTVLTESLMPANLLYAAGHDLSDPYLSPLFGDFSTGFPPTLLATGTRDLFLSNTVRMHRALRAAGVSAELHVLEAAPHGGFFASAPEDRELEREVRRFIDAQWTY